jgi:hypothetical protein
MNIIIRDIVGENAITLEDGEKTYQKIVPALRSEEKISLDFAGVKVFASPFFNSAIGRLLKDFSTEILNRFLSFDNLNPIGAEVLKKVIENSKQFYSKPEAQKAIEQAIAQRAQEH